MTTPKKMTADELSGVLMYVGKAYPVAAFVVEAHIAALEQEVAAAEARGFERAKAQAAAICDGMTDHPIESSPQAERIRAMQDGQWGGEGKAK